MWLKNCVIKLEARMSDRVPFGTGPAVKHIIALAEEHKAYNYYHPQVFICLKTIYAHLDTLYVQRMSLGLWYQNLTDDCVFALQTIGIETFIDKQTHMKAVQFYKQFHIWFDAFKTLKFIHALRDNYYQNIPLNQGVLEAPFDIEAEVDEFIHE